MKKQDKFMKMKKIEATEGRMKDGKGDQTQRGRLHARLEHLNISVGWVFRVHVAEHRSLFAPQRHSSAAGETVQTG